MLRKYQARDVRLLRKYTDDILLAASQIHDVPRRYLVGNRKRFNRVKLARRDIVRILLNTVRASYNDGTITIKPDGFEDEGNHNRLSSGDIADLLNLKSHSPVLTIFNEIKSTNDKDSDKFGDKYNDITYTEYLLQLQEDVVESK